MTKAIRILALSAALCCGLTLGDAFVDFARLQDAASGNVADAIEKFENVWRVGGETFQLIFDGKNPFFTSHVVGWWNGPNVCVERDERLELATEPSAGHSRVHSCTGTGSDYRCETKETKNGTTRISSEVHSCCHGFLRREGEKGCPESILVQPLLEKLAGEGASEFARLLQNRTFDVALANTNVTVFAPEDGSLGPLSTNGSTHASLDDKDRAVMDEKLNERLRMHVVAGLQRISRTNDEQILAAVNESGAIRINKYRNGVTANCVRVLRQDLMANNALVNVVSGPLEPLSRSIEERLRYSRTNTRLYQDLEDTGLMQMLKEPGKYTLLAPPQRAFNRLGPNVPRPCMKKILRNHILPNVICSSAIPSEARTPSLIHDDYVNVSRREADGAIFFNGKRATRVDILATNGIIHEIEGFVHDDTGISLADAAEQADRRQFAQLLRASGLDKELESEVDLWAYAPPDKAIQEMAASNANFGKDVDELKSFLKHHIRRRGGSEDGKLTSLDGQPLTLRKHNAGSFGFQTKLTIQCSLLSDTFRSSCIGNVVPVNKVFEKPTGKLLDRMRADPQLSEFVSLIELSTIKQGLDDVEDLTVLAVPNEALARLSEQTMNKLRTDKNRLASFLKAHMLHGQLCCGGFFAGNSRKAERTLDGSFIYFTPTAEGFNISSSYRSQPLIRVESCDRLATNGLVHVIGEALPAAVNRYVQDRPSLLQLMFNQMDRIKGLGSLMDG